MAGQLTSRRYDQCAINQQTGQFTDPFSYNMDLNKYVNCGNKSHIDPATLTNTESCLRGTDRIASDCNIAQYPNAGTLNCFANNSPYQPNYLQDRGNNAPPFPSNSGIPQPQAPSCASVPGYTWPADGSASIGSMLQAARNGQLQAPAPAPVGYSRPQPAPAPLGYTRPAPQQSPAKPQQPSFGGLPQQQAPMGGFQRPQQAPNGYSRPQAPTGNQFGVNNIKKGNGAAGTGLAGLFSGIFGGTMGGNKPQGPVSFGNGMFGGPRQASAPSQPNFGAGNVQTAPTNFGAGNLQPQAPTGMNLGTIGQELQQGVNQGIQQLAPVVRGIFNQ